MDGRGGTESLDQLTVGLTEAQREAVLHKDGPLLILAGPGSGKTRVVTHRVAALLAQGVSAHEILALTFTNKAADEMRQRLAQLVTGPVGWVGTFHRFCARLLRRHARLVGLEENFSIYDVSDTRQVLKRAAESCALHSTHVHLVDLAEEISRAKNYLMTPDEYIARPGNVVGTLVQDVYPAYQSRLLAANAVDFDDLLLHVASLLRENPDLRATLDERFRYILVDEYQDTNFAQYAIVRALSQDHPNLAVTGDPDQSIYGWRGANLENILSFEKDFPDVRVVRLEQNYRSTRRILEVAEQLIQNNSRRRPKSLFTDNAPGEPVRLVRYATGQDEADDIARQIAESIRSGARRPSEFAIFYRVNALSLSLENALRAQGVPFQIIQGVEFYQRREIKDVLAYLFLINNPRDDEALLRIINVPPRRIGKKTIQQLVQWARDHDANVLDAARRAGLIEGISKRAAVHVAEFVALYDRLCLHGAESLENLVECVLAETGYRDWLRQSKDDADQDRLGNLHELLAAAREFDLQHPDEPPLETFLEQAALVNDTDDWDAKSEKVSLMTLHAAKGLEFPVVYIIAVEEGLLPHERNRQDPVHLEEERRLLFVGITRAQQQLQISSARLRPTRGQCRGAVPSPFLMELPRRQMDTVDLAPQSVEPQTTQASDIHYDPDLEWDFGGDDVDQTEPVRAARRRQKPVSSVSMMTAADLMGRDDSPAARPDPSVFRAGMLVSHPEHGPGKIIAIRGQGRRRQATVRFFNSPTEVSYVLVHSELQPLQRGSS